MTGMTLSQNGAFAAFRRRLGTPKTCPELKAAWESVLASAETIEVRDLDGLWEFYLDKDEGMRVTKKRRMMAAFRLERRLFPCSVIGIAPSGMLEVLARLGRPGSKLCRCLIHPSRLLHSLPPGNAHYPLEEERIGDLGSDEEAPLYRIENRKIPKRTDGR